MVAPGRNLQRCRMGGVAAQHHVRLRSVVALSANPNNSLSSTPNSDDATDASEELTVGAPLSPHPTDLPAQAAQPAPLQSLRAARSAAAAGPEDAWWQNYAIYLDDRAAALASARARVTRAAAVEDFAAAAAAQTSVHRLEASNPLAALAAEQAAAVAAQDYARAAQARDAALAPLEGWWAVAPDASDPWGHVIRVTRAFGRLEARAYTPLELAEMQGWTLHSAYHHPLKAKTASAAGVPLFEVLFSRDDGGAVSHHAFLLPDDVGTDDKLNASVARNACSSGAHTSTASRADADSTPASRTSLAVASPLKTVRNILRRSAGDQNGTPQGNSTTVPPNSAARRQAEAWLREKLNRMHRNQLAPRERQERSGSLHETLDDLDRMDAEAAMQDLLARCSGENPGDCACHPTRLSSRIDLVDRTTFTLEVPATARGSTKSRKLTYRRMDDSLLGQSHSDPLSGYFLGSFGAHGPELLHLQRGLWEGEEAIIAYKVTGDPHVPAGQVSFRAKVGPGRGLSTSIYPAQMDVQRRFSGEGCVADVGFTDPHWCDGDLLAFGGSRSKQFKRLTGGAGLGFIWNMPNTKRFLILLSRVQAEDGP